MSETSGKIVNKIFLIDANELFNYVKEPFKHELEVKNMLIDNSCVFIKYRAGRHIFQNQLAEIF